MDVIGKKRDVFPQSIKGLCILLVVLIHLPWGQNGEWTAWIWIAVRKLINFAVAAFFFLSAYYTKSYVLLKEEGIICYWAKRVRRLLLPYIVWSIVYIFIIPVLTTGNVPEKWGGYLLTGKGPLYFLLALLQFTLLNPLLQRYKNFRIPNLVFWLITLMYIAFYYSYNIKKGVEFKPEQTFCFPWFACYYLGLKMQDKEWILRRKLSRCPVITLLFVCMFSLALSIVEAMFIYKYTGIFSFAISQITIGSILYSVAALVLISRLWLCEQSEGNGFLSRLGDYSMGIFLLHPLYNWVFKFFVLHLPEGTTLYRQDYGFMLVHILVWIFSVVVSYYTAKVLSRKFPLLVPILGLK